MIRATAVAAEKAAARTKRLALGLFSTLCLLVECLLAVMMNAYDIWVYSRLQTLLMPLVVRIPRHVQLTPDGPQLTVFTANIVTYARTTLVIPIAWFLKYDFNWAAFWCVVLHDFLDHLDGIVAKVHKVKYPDEDDTLLGGFLDAQCDKIVNILCLWTLMQQWSGLSIAGSEWYLAWWAIGTCYTTIGYELVLACVRTDEYFSVKWQLRERERCRRRRQRHISDESIDLATVELATVEAMGCSTGASMEGKLKEKLESIGIALLCLANRSSIHSTTGVCGLVCMMLAIRMAHKSLLTKWHKRARAAMWYDGGDTAPSSDDGDDDDSADDHESEDDSIDSDSLFEPAEMKLHEYDASTATRGGSNDVDRATSGKYSYRRKKRLDRNNNNNNNTNNTNTSGHRDAIIIDEKRGGTKRTSVPRQSMPVVEDTRVDKVYTVGCFDLFHHGHERLIERMRQLGKKVIVGVHDSRSIYKLKNRVPIDGTETRMLNVKRLADQVFCVAGCDPSDFMTCIVDLGANETAMYVRGNDMLDFPSKKLVEHMMPIKYLPYTEGVSSSQLRDQHYAHVARDDPSYLQAIN